MSASISTKQKNIAMSFIKKTAGHITGATGQYISEVMPISSSTISGAKDGLNELQSTFATTSSSILPKIRQLKIQNGFKSISNWFMEKEDSYDDYENADSHLNFDIGSDPDGEIIQSQITEWGKNANQISRTVVETSHKMVEAQLTATANILTAVDKQTAVISSGFDKTNSTLSKILEVLTKNTTTLIETTIAANSSDKDPAGKLASGKFDMSSYKKMVVENFKSSQLGMLAGFLPMLSGGNLKHMFTPQNLMQMLIGKGIDKVAPNMKQNLSALDSAVEDVIMGSLIRLGEKGNEWSGGFRGTFGKIFGINSTREDATTTRSSLELKSVPFDSISKESIDNAIPGYLRRILVAVGGEDLVYDYRSRSFKSQGSIKKEFYEMAARETGGRLSNAGENVRKTLGNDKLSQMTYELMINELGTRVSGGGARNTISKFGNQEETQEYILNTVLKGMLPSLSPQEIEAAKQFANNLGKVTAGGLGSHEIMNQVSRTNVRRNQSTKEYLSRADSYNVDMSFIRDNESEDRKAIAKSYGKEITPNSSIRTINPESKLQGVNYTNMALYEIYRRLNEGINVFQVGKNNSRRKPFEKFGDDYLTKPLGHKPRQTPTTSSSFAEGGGLSGIYADDGSSNLLENQTGEDGSPENLTRGQRFSRWGKHRGGNLAKAIFSGSPEQVREAFGLAIRDITQASGSFAKDKLGDMNQKAGNISGYLKHKITGSGYTYKDGDKEVTIKENQKGGLLGYFDNIIFGEGGAKEAAKTLSRKGSKWFESVSGYFNYGTNKEEKGVQSRRKKILGTSVGAMLGMGLLGGPLGVIMGSVAGSAIAQTDGIGNKIKGFLFGKEEFDDKGNPTGKRKLGIIDRAINGVVDPIRYQVGKTMSTFSGILKKNILGPLSNVGAAIVDRMSNAAGGVVTKTFNKIFSGAGWIVKSLLKAAISPVGMVTGAIGGATRGVASAGGGLIGGGLNFLASRIESTKGLTNQRSKSQHDEVAQEEIESGYSDGQRKWYDPFSWKKDSNYGAWKKKQDERRSKIGDVSDYLKEENPTQEEIAAASKKTEEHTEELLKVQTDVHKHMTTKSATGSIFTHDHIMHDKMDELINLITGGKKSGKGIGKSNINEADAFANAMTGTAAQLAAIGGVDSDDEKDVSSIAMEASKEGSSKTSIISKFKNILNRNKSKDKEKVKSEEKKEDNWLSKILGTVSGGFSSLLSGFLGNWQMLVAGGLMTLTLFNKDFRQFATDAVGRLGTGIKDLKDWVVNGGDQNNTILNTVTSPFDMRADRATDYVNPFAAIYHTEKDAAGNDIINHAATNAKNAPWQHMSAINTVRESKGIGYGIDKQRSYEAAKAAKASGNMDAYRQHMREAANYSRQGKEFTNDRFGTPTRRVATGLMNAGVALQGGQYIGQGVGWATSKVLQKYGVSEETSEQAGRVAQVAGTIKGTTAIYKSASKEDGVVKKLINWAIEKITGLLQKIGSMISAKWPPSGNRVTKLISDLGSKFTEKSLTPFVEKIRSLAIKCGVTVSAGAVTGGIATLAIAAAGAISQGCNTEQLFGIKSGEADSLMVAIAAALGGFFNLPFACLIEIVDLIFAPVNNGKGIRQVLAEIIYESASEDGGASLSNKQGKLKEEVDNYNKTYKTNLSVSAYNDMTNRGMVNRILHGNTVKNEKGDIVVENGAVQTTGGIVGAYQGAKNWLFGDKKSESTGAIKAPVQETIEGTEDWLANESPWAKDREESPKEWMGEKVDDLYSNITSGITDMDDGAKDWAKTKAPWVKDRDDSAKKWITQKADSIWNSLLPSTSYMGGIGGPDRNLRRGGIGGSEDEVDSPTSSQANSISIGGNPLNKKFDISSPFGGGPENSWRKGGFHKGVDLVPGDGTQEAEVGATFSGKVIDVDTDATSGAGNYVFYQTPDGSIIKNMHLKSNSIPSNIQPGAQINAGDKIGDMGSTGHSTGPHLHYQIDKGGKSIDPTPSISGGTTMSSFANSSSSTYESSESTSSSISEGPLGSFLSKIKEFGSHLLNKISGGLFGTSMNSSSSISTFGSSGHMGMGTIDGPVKMISNKDVLKYAKDGQTFEILDLKSGKNWQVVGSFSPEYHTDWTPLTSKDTDIIKGILGGSKNWSDGNSWSWTPRPAIAKLGADGKEMVAVGIHLRPHAGLVGGNPGSPIKSSSDSSYQEIGGHMCMHYGDSYSKAANGIPKGENTCNGQARVAYELGNKMFNDQKSSFNPTGKHDSDIWNYLKGKIGNDYGVAGLMGNLYAESHLTPNMVQGNIGKPQKNEEYTNQIDKGSINFVSDTTGGGGYGLAQWTSQGRKQKLLNLARSRGKSIGDLGVQLDHLWGELPGYRPTYNAIKNAKSIRQASDMVLTDFERPADQSEKAKSYRASLGQGYYEKFSGNKAGGVGGPDDIPISTILGLMKSGTGSLPIKFPSSSGSSNIRSQVLNYAIPQILGQMNKKKKDLKKTPDIVKKETSKLDESYLSEYNKTKDDDPLLVKELKLKTLGEEVPNKEKEENQKESSKLRPVSKFVQFRNKLAPKLLNVGKSKIRDRMDPMFKDFIDLDSPDFPSLKVPGPPVSSKNSPESLLKSTDNSTNQELVSIMSKVLEQLQQINGNTGQSSDLLDSLNNKDFVDVGLRESVSQLSKIKQKKPTSSYNHGNVRTVNSMIKP